MPPKPRQTRLHTLYSLMAMLLVLLLLQGKGWGQEVIVEWNFENAAKRSASTLSPVSAFSYAADAGIASNINIAPIRVVGPTSLAWNQGTGGTVQGAINGTNWLDGEWTHYWYVQFSTSGYEALSVSSAQRTSDTQGPRDFHLQYSIDGATWNHLLAIEVGSDLATWMPGTITNVPLPAVLNDMETVYLRWIQSSNISVPGLPITMNGGTNRIDDIIIRGTPLPLALDPPTVTVTHPDCLVQTGTIVVTSPTGAFEYSIDGVNYQSSVTFSGLAPGPYGVRVRTTGVPASASNPTPVTINPAPAVPNPPTANDISTCFNGSVFTATATAPPGASVTYFDASSGGSVAGAPSGSAPATYTAWAEARHNTSLCVSPSRTQVTLSIGETPTPPTASNQTICYDGNEHSITASPPPGASIDYYNAASGGSLVSAPTGTAAATYTAWAESVHDISGCSSIGRVQLSLTINPAPNPPVASDLTVCYDGNTYTNVATTSQAGTRIDYYNQESGGTTTPAPSSTGPGEIIRWAETVFDATSCKSISRTPVVLDIGVTPDPPAAFDETRCYDGSMHEIFVAAPPGSYVNYYSAPTGGTIVDPISESEAGDYTVWAESVHQSTCISNSRSRVHLQITDNNIPPPVGIELSVCYDGNRHTAQATPPLGHTPRYFTTATGVDQTVAPNAVNIGTYTAWAMSVNAAGCASTDRARVSLEIKSTPTAYAGADQEIQWGANYVIADALGSGSGALTYSWTPPDYLNNPGIQNPTITGLQESMLYTLTVVQNNNQCSATDQVYFEVKGGPLNVTIQADHDELCLGGSVILKAMPTGGSENYQSYTWSSDQGAFTASGQSVEVSPEVTTTYTVVVNDGFNETSASITIQVNPLPPFEPWVYLAMALLPTEFCMNDPIYELLSPLLDQLPEGTYTIDGESLSSFDPGEAGPGIYRVIYTISDSNTGCTNSLDFTLTVKESPVVYAGEDQTIAYGTGTAINDATASIGVSGGLTYFWQPDGLLTDASVLHPVIPYLEEETVFTFTASHPNGCSASDQLTISVEGGPLAVNIVASQTTVCQGQQVSLEARATGGNSEAFIAYSWTADRGGFTSSEATVVVTPSETTTYTVVVDDGFSQRSDEVTIVVNALPEMSCPSERTISKYSTEYVFSGGSPPGGTYLFEGNATTLISPSDVGEGTYTVEYTFTDTEGCSNSCFFDITVADIPEEFTLFLTSAPEGAGAISGAGDYSPNDMVNISATANRGFTFSHWTGLYATLLDDPNAASTSFTMPMDDVTLTAVFVECRFNFTVEYNEAHGAVYATNYPDLDRDDISNNYTFSVACGDNVRIDVVPAMGYEIDFVRINGTLWDAGGVYEIPNIQSDKLFQVIFKKLQYTLTYGAGSNGRIEGNSPQTVEHGASGSPVEAIPDPGYHFTGWSDGRTDDPRTDLNVTSDVDVTALFAINEYTLTYLAGPNGSISGQASQNVAYGGSGLAVEAVADLYFCFQAWDDGRTDNPRTDTGVGGDINVTAIFERCYFEVTFTVDMVYANGFRKGVDQVFMTGSMFDYAIPGDIPDQEMMPVLPDNDLLSRTLMLPRGRYFYKYFLNPGLAGEEWPAAPVRLAEVFDHTSFYDYFGSPTDPTHLAYIHTSEPLVYPNPASSVLHVASGSSEPLGILRLISMTGQVVYASGPLKQQHHQIEIGQLKPGMYVLQVQTFSGWFTRKVQINHF